MAHDQDGREWSGRRRRRNSVRRQIPDPQMRRGAITANGQRAEISQSAGTCDIVLGQSAASFNQGGGTGQVQVRASSPMCGWSASSDAD